MRNILGLHINTGQTAAALIRDGVVMAAAAEERFNRVKQSRAFPREAICFCLREANLASVADLDGIAVSWNPAENMRHINLSGFTEWRRYDPEWLYILPNHIMSMAGEAAFSGPVLEMRITEDGRCPLFFVNHHHAHIAHAISHSPFEEGMAVAIDEYGEHDSVTVAVFSGNDFKVIRRIAYPNSLGVFYAAFTEYLGFKPNLDEWKVMGAAAYGDPSRFRSAIEKILDWDGDEGAWVLDTRFIEHANMKRAGYINDRLIARIGIPVRNPEDYLRQEHFDLAAAVQTVFEEQMFSLISYYARKTGATNLAASGGCMMNSLANGKIIEQTPIRRVFVPYAAADNGGAMGAALYVHDYWRRCGRRRYAQAPSPFLGPEFSEAEITETLQKCKLCSTTVEDPVEYAAEALAAGKIIGWFQGRMEFGERALGNRSILADPRSTETKQLLNAAVKFREAFRPFAPSIPAEEAPKWFEMPKEAAAPYMEQVFTIRPECRMKIPAVVHNDGTGRLQTVTRESNPLYYRLLRAFEERTGIPIIVNTSFNLQGEPIVCSPADAIRTFYSCGLDMLILGKHVLNKGIL